MTAVLLTKPRPWVILVTAVAMILVTVFLIAIGLVGLIWLVLLGGLAL